MFGRAGERRPRHSVWKRRRARAHSSSASASHRRSAAARRRFVMSSAYPERVCSALETIREYSIVCGISTLIGHFTGRRSMEEGGGSCPAHAGRHVFVIGADYAIGYSVCVHLRRTGCRVVAGCALPDGVGARLLRDAGCQVLAVDARRPETLAAAGAAARAVLRQDAADSGEPARLSVLVFSAELLVLGRLLAPDADPFDLASALMMMRECYALLGGGRECECRERLVLVKPACGAQTDGVAPYAAVNADVDLMVSAARQALAGWPVDVSDTCLSRDFVTENMLQRQQQYLDKLVEDASRQRKETEEETEAGSPADDQRESSSDPVFLAKDLNLRENILTPILDPNARLVFIGFEYFLLLLGRLLQLVSCFIGGYICGRALGALKQERQI